MKSILQSVIVNTFSLWATSQILPGLSIKGGLDIVLFGGAVLALMNLLVKPVLTALTLPLSLLTMGLSSWLINILMVYLLTILVPQISISSHTFQGISIGTISISKLTLSAFQTAVVAAFLLSFITNFLFWLFRR